MTDQKPLKCQEGTVYISDLNNAREVQKECYKHLKNKTIDQSKSKEGEKE